MGFNAFQRFAKDTRGNFAIMTAITFPMLIAGVALSVDVSNNLRLKTDLQNATDAAVLYAARNFQDKKTWPTAMELKKFTEGNLAPGTPVTVTPSFDSDKMVVVLKSRATFKPMLMNYFGKNNFSVSSLSKAEVGVASVVEFALALDTTGSMNELTGTGTRLTDLKKAAKDFVKTMFDQKDRGANVKGGIVPFAQYVNVGVSRRNVNWMNVPADIDTRQYGQKSVTVPVGTAGATCVTTAAYVRQIPIGFAIQMELLSLAQ
jgi:Flp pilus assembly protein TadG